MWQETILSFGQGLEEALNVNLNGPPVSGHSVAF